MMTIPSATSRSIHNCNHFLTETAKTMEESAIDATEISCIQKLFKFIKSFFPNTELSELKQEIRNKLKTYFSEKEKSNEISLTIENKSIKINKVDNEEKIKVEVTCNDVKNKIIIDGNLGDVIINLCTPAQYVDTKADARADTKKTNSFLEEELKEKLQIEKTETEESKKQNNTSKEFPILQSKTETPQKKDTITISKEDNSSSEEFDLIESEELEKLATETPQEQHKTYEYNDTSGKFSIFESQPVLGNKGIQNKCRDLLNEANDRKKTIIQPIGIQSRGALLEDHAVLIVCRPGFSPLIIDSNSGNNPLVSYPTYINKERNNNPTINQNTDRIGVIYTHQQSATDTKSCWRHTVQQCVHYAYQLQSGIAPEDLMPYDKK